MTLLGFAGEKLGSNWEKIQPLLHYLDYAVVVASSRSSSGPSCGAPAGGRPGAAGSAPGGA